MKTPRFWNNKNPLSTALLPLAGIYYIASCWRIKKTKTTTLPVPVICIGNLTAGGAGKTPVALAIGDILKQKNKKAFYVSRGYGGNAHGPLVVDLANHTAKHVGDEPLLLAQKLPTVVGKDRVRACQLAIAKGAEVIVMDDGFQNPTIAKDLSFVVVDRRLSFGNERILPAGPLREPVKKGLSRAHALIIINPANFLPTALPDIPVVLARSRPDGHEEALRGKRIIAFSGIAYPKKFFDMLRKMGTEMVEKIPFPDHHNYTQKELEHLQARAELHHAQLVTTAKDAVRLPEDFKPHVTVVQMQLDIENPEILNGLIDKVLDEKTKT